MTPEDREADLSTFVILKDEDDLTDALKTFADYVDNIKATWTAANPARILIVDALQDRPWKGCLLGAAYCAREEGWSGDEALRFVGTRCSEAGAPYASGKELEEDIPSDWFAALNSVAQKTEIGRLFCHDCFEDWRYGASDDVASTKVAAAIRRLRARDDALEVLDLRNEGPLGWELAGVLGAAAGHSITLVSLDVASCQNLLNLLKACSPS